MLWPSVFYSEARIEVLWHGCLQIALHADLPRPVLFYMCVPLKLLVALLFTLSNKLVPMINHIDIFVLRKTLKSSQLKKKEIRVTNSIYLPKIRLHSSSVGFKSGLSSKSCWLKEFKKARPWDSSFLLRSRGQKRVQTFFL